MSEIPLDLILNAIIAVLKEIFKPFLTPINVDQNLVDKPPSLVGRKRDLAQLRKKLSRYRVVFIWGPIGVGKSALALAMAHEFLRQAQNPLRRLVGRLQRSPWFEAIVWLELDRQRNLNDVIRTIAQTLKLDVATPLPKLRQSVLDIMRRRRVLLILDNAETMNQEVWDFVREVPNPSKVLLISTTRYLRYLLDLRDAQLLELQSLDKKEASRLVQKEAEEHSLSLTKDQVSQLAEASQGLPWVIKFALGSMVLGNTLEDVLNMLRNPPGDLVPYLVNRQVDDIRRDPVCWRVFLAAGLLDPERGFSREALSQTAGLAPGQENAAFAELELRNLLYKRGDDRFGMRPIMIHAVARWELARDPELQAQLANNLVVWLRDKMLTHKMLTHPHPQDVKLLQMEAPNVLQALKWLQKRGRIEELALLLREARFLVHDGRPKPYLDLAEAVFSWALQNGRGDLLIDLVWQVIEWAPQPWVEEFERRWWPQLEPLLAKQGKPGEIERGLVKTQMAYIKLENKPTTRPDYTKLASEVLEEIEKNIDQTDPEAAVCLCNNLGLVWMDRSFGEPDYQFSKKWLEHGLSLLERHQDRIRDPKDWETVMKGNLALLLARADGKYEEAAGILEKIRENLRWKHDQAEWHLVMAVYAYRRCRMGEAWRHGIEGERLLQEMGLDRLDTDEGREWFNELRGRLSHPWRRWVASLGCGWRRRPPRGKG